MHYVARASLAAGPIVLVDHMVKSLRSCRSGTWSNASRKLFYCYGEDVGDMFWMDTKGKKQSSIADQDMLPMVSRSRRR